jgi:hypothetical protein
MILLLSLSWVLAYAEDQPKPVFIKATCDGKLASTLFSSFKEAIKSSKKYEVVPDLSDKGKMDVVLNIVMTCGERNNAVSIASVYGLSKCFGSKNCHAALNGSTLNVLMCDPNGETVCGRELFKELEYVLSTVGMPSIKLE